jgi:hypothetical protein
MPGRLWRVGRSSLDTSPYGIKTTRNQLQNKLASIGGLPMKKNMVTFVIAVLIFLVPGVNVVFSTTVEFWTTETQSDRLKTIQLLMDTFQALNSDIAVKLVPVDEKPLVRKVYST